MKRRILVWAAIVTLAGCTLDKQNAPPLAGPSTFALAVTVTASPDILTQDGQAQSRVDIVARDANNQPVHQDFRLDIMSGSTPVQFGTLSRTTASTDTTGHDAVTYTAPPAPPPTGADSTVITIVATPVGTNFANNGFQGSVAIKLVRPGAPLAPPPASSSMTSAFIFSPGSPKAGDTVQFDGSSSTGSIVSYSWSFGDGSTASGVRVTHTYPLEGDFNVVLTVKDQLGSAVSSTQKVTITPTKNPTPKFTFSPTSPVAGTPANFNASESTADSGHQVVEFDWDFGDGNRGSGVLVSHTYAQAGGYTVTLSVTDDTGRVGVISSTLTIASSAPQASFTFTPTSPHAADAMTFDASGSKVSIQGRTIVSYAWDFGDGTTGSGLSVSHPPYGAGNANKTIIVTLTVTDSAGQSSQIQKSFTIQP